MKAFAFNLLTLLTKFLNFLSAFSVTEQVLKTYMSAISLGLTLLYLLKLNFFAICSVSVKFNLQPRVLKAIFVKCLVLT